MKRDTFSDHAKWMKIAMRSNLFPHYNTFRRKVLEYTSINSSSSVLDFGCGVGLFEEYIVEKLHDNFGKISGVDIDPQIIDIAKHTVKNNKIEFFLVDKTGKLPFSDNSFDIVTSSLVLHLLNCCQKEMALSEMLRVLKPGGKAIFAEIGKPYNLYGDWIKFITIKLWTKLWEFESNSIESFEGKLPDFILSSGFKNIKTVDKLKGHIYFMTCTKAC